MKTPRALFCRALFPIWVSLLNQGNYEYVGGGSIEFWNHSSETISATGMKYETCYYLSAQFTTLPFLYFLQVWAVVQFGTQTSPDFQGWSCFPNKKSHERVFFVLLVATNDILTWCGKCWGFSISMHLLFKASFTLSKGS